MRDGAAGTSVVSLWAGPCVAGLRVSWPMAWLSLCGTGLGLREGLKRCLRGMAGEPATSVHRTGSAYVVSRMRFARSGPGATPVWFFRMPEYKDIAAGLGAQPLRI